jgi:hypothetical protein
MKITRTEIIEKEFAAELLNVTDEIAGKNQIIGNHGFSNLKGDIIRWNVAGSHSPYELFQKFLGVKRLSG